MEHKEHHDHDHGEAHAHGHGHSHGHGHGHAHVISPDGVNLRMGIAVALNLVFVIVEGGFGFISNSVALIADAGHNLSDVLGLVCAWGALMLGRRPPGPSSPMVWDVRPCWPHWQMRSCCFWPAALLRGRRRAASDHRHRWRDVPS